MKKLVSPLLIAALAAPAYAQNAPSIESISQRIAEENVEESNLDALYLESLVRTQLLLAIERSEAINSSIGVSSQTSNFLIIPAATGSLLLDGVASYSAIKVVNAFTPSTSKGPWRKQFKALKKQALAANAALARVEKSYQSSTVVQAFNEAFPSIADDVATISTSSTAAATEVELRSALEMSDQRVAALQRQLQVSAEEKAAIAQLSEARGNVLRTTTQLNNHLAIEPGLVRGVARGARNLAKTSIVFAGVGFAVWVIGDTVMLQLPEDTTQLKTNLRNEINEINATLVANDVDLQKAIEIAYERITKK